ncbi:origin recognition complex subunit 5 [Lingula anatina]|uniref:Origin recognition complex subunit 5 n=1 Tax=Lingula anatina TaxID=7574 RepID=A0A1S3I818_LINAN|nr:origin recognition complex subunit 5 [Lingula anatina]|eukprot:XP_013394402.1 origin recognition complex subunit 5 [Lingula anatina]
MDVATAKEQLYELIPGRKGQIDLLLSLCSPPQPYPAVFVYGVTATGKSLVVNQTMKIMKLPHVLVNCVECYSAKLLYEEILNALLGDGPCPANDFSVTHRCDNMNDFVRALTHGLQETLVDDPFYIVLDKAERLRDMEGNVLPALLKLQELTKCKVSVILITEIVWEKFWGGTGMVDPFPIYFQDYTKEELLEIMALDSPEDYPVTFYKSYITLVLSVFYLACRNLAELRHLAQLNFPLYVEPIKSGDATISESRKLWKHIEPFLKKALQTVYLREVSSKQWESMQQKLMEDEEGEKCMGAAGGPVPLHVARANVELPFYSKYLLVAAYLASYNPAKSDRRFFTKNCGKQRKSNRAVKKHERTSNQLLGPKPFPLDRLMAIFHSIIEGRVVPTANIFSQVTSLVTLQLLAQVGSSDQLEGPKYKCLVSLDFIKQVARTVQFDIVQYLYDFV